MSANIIDISTFTSPIVVPTDGDALTAASNALADQGLSNRTRYLKDYADGIAKGLHFAVYSVDGTGVASGAKFTLVQITEFGGFSLASNEITVPEAGDYMVTVHMLASSSAGAVLGLVAVQDAGTPFFNAASYKQVDGGSNNSLVFSFTAYASVGTPGSHKLSLASLTSNLTVLALTATAALVVKRLR